MIPVVGQEPDPSDQRGTSINGNTGGSLVVLTKPLPAVLAAPPNAMDLVMALQRRWVLAGCLALAIGGMAAGGLWFAHHTTFTARTLLHVHARQPFIVAEVSDVRSESGSYHRTQIALVKSRLVLNNALKNPKVLALDLIKEKPDPVGWLEKELIADFSVAPEILRIALNGDDPAELTILVDAVRESYVRDIVYKEHFQRSQRLDKLRELHVDLSRELDRKRTLHKSMAEGSGNTGPQRDMLQRFILAQLQSLQNRLVDVETEILKEQALELFAKQADDGKSPVVLFPKKLVEDNLSKHPELVGLIKTVKELEGDLQYIELMEKEPKKDANYLRKQELLETKKKALHVLREKLRPVVEAKLQKDQLEAGRNPFYDSKQNLAMLSALKKLYTGEIQRQMNALDQFKKETVQVEWLQEEIVQVDTIVKKLSSQITTLEIELKAPERISLLEEAIAVRDTDTRIRKSAMGGLAALAAVLFGVALLEFRKRKVRSVDEVVRGLEMRLMGTVPAIPFRSRQRLGNSADSRDAYWQNVLTEAVDAARAMLLHLAKQESRQVVMISSAVGGEGKTMLSCHLAVSMARAGFRTLLVDCDLRRPAVHKVFDLPLEPGFGDMLRAQINPNDVLQPGPIDGLSIATAGHCDSATFQALAKHKSKEIFKHLKQRFDFVLVDSAPILPAADSLLLAASVDGVILSILRDVSRLPSVYAAYERLAALHAPILGVVVSGTPADSYEERYSYQTAAAENPKAPGENVYSDSKDRI